MHLWEGDLDLSSPRRRRWPPTIPHDHTIASSFGQAATTENYGDGERNEEAFLFSKVSQASSLLTSETARDLLRLPSLRRPAPENDAAPRQRGEHSTLPSYGNASAPLHLVVQKPND